MAQAVQAPPTTPVEPVTEILHGIEITDPYRWLEDQNSPRTRRWLDEQAAYTRAYFGAIPDREQIHKQVGCYLASKEVISDVWNVGDRYFFLQRGTDREQPFIVMRDGLFGDETTLVDTGSRIRGSTTAVAIRAISEDGRFLAYSVRQGGTDHSTVQILDISRNTLLPDYLAEGFCSGIVFAPDGSGFYYSHSRLGDPRPNYRAVFWHQFGTKHLEDEQVFFAGEQPNLILGIIHSPEAELLAFPLCLAGKVRLNSIHLQYIGRGTQTRPLLQDIEGYLVPFFFGRDLLAYTDVGAPNFRIVRIDLSYPDPSHWHNVVPESDQRIQEFAVAGDQIVITRIDCFSTKIETWGLSGKKKKDVPICPHGTVNLLNRTNATGNLFYRYSSLCNAPSVYRYDVRQKTLFTWHEANNSFDPSIVAEEEVVYTSKDRTPVPLYIAGRKELLHGSPLPTFITGYGGFGSCVTPQFTAFATFLIEQGFLFAVPALRGGSELGEEWHRAGRREKRQTSFDDFIAAAEWLVTQGLSVEGRIAIGGGSNAGLLVGAAITQRPDLFRAAICLGPLLDMTRYHLFDFAAGWGDEYGSPEDEQDFRSLIAYSPYHRVKDRVPYPSVLLISGDADTRCNPMHARKMAARLQAANASCHPILLDYKAPWGHMPAQPLSIRIDALTDRLAFICHELDVRVRPGRPE